MERDHRPAIDQVERNVEGLDQGAMSRALTRTVVLRVNDDPAEQVVYAYVDRVLLRAQRDWLLDELELAGWGEDTERQQGLLNLLDYLLDQADAATSPDGRHAPEAPAR